ncbi:YhdP family protein [Sinimarinibacterium thermocellulolyticum]|uniref:YhdP family protein n=1 Tax=Sinimarinibacterium thermocellulolyticum TaxID=3170016 RepID=A0ABV2A7D9_9GAMM
MERTKRRWWTWAVSLTAAAVVLGAVASGAFQLAVLAVPSYREDLAVWVGEATGRPVQIGGVSLSWRGLAPRVELSGITLYSDDGASQISVERLSLGFALRRLLRGEWLPSRLGLSGLRVSIEGDAHGQWRIAGFDAEARPAAEPWWQGLDRFDRVELENCELRIAHPRLGEAPTHLYLTEARIDRVGTGAVFEAGLRLPADKGGTVTLEGEIETLLAPRDEWAGTFELRFDDLQPQGWLRPWLLPGVQVLSANLDGRVSGEIRGGVASRVRVELGSGGLALARAGVLSSASATTAVIDLLRNPQGWRVDVAELRFDDQILLRGSLRMDRLDDGWAWDVDADRLELTRLAPWGGVWRDAPVALQLLAGSGGEVEGLVLRYREGADAPRFAVRARLRDLALRSQHGFELRGLDGEISADENGGSLRLAEGPVTLSLPQTMDPEVPLDRLVGDLGWARTAAGWRVYSDGFALRLASISASGRVELQFPRDDKPRIDLAATLTAGDALDALPYMPRHWPDSLKNWLRRGIVAARVPHGDLRIRGPLSDFPYESRPTGEWSLELEVADATLDYAPDWPRIDDLRTRLLFSGNGLRAEVLAARSLDSHVNEGTVRIDDFDARRLDVDVQIDGTLPGHYAFLRASPLRRPLAALLERTQVQGEARVSLHLDIPLREVAATAVAGRVVVDGASLRYADLEPPIEALSGAIAFNRQGVTAENLRARFAGVPLDLRIDAWPGTAGVIHAAWRFAPQVGDEGMSRFIPGFVRQHLDGASDWHAELPLRADAALTLQSDLRGTAITLPPPLAKAADEAETLRLRIGGADMGATRVGLHYGTRAAMDLLLRGAEARAVDGLHLRLGADETPLARPGRVDIDGSIDELDLAAWAQLFAPPAAPQAFADGAATTADARLRIDGADIAAGRLRWGRTTIGATRLIYAPQDEGWRVDLDGAGARGELRWLRQDGGRLVARLQHLNVETLHLPGAEAGDEDARHGPVDPTALPTLDLTADALRLGQTRLGRGELVTQRIDGGQAIRSLRLVGGDAELAADGSWRRTDGRSFARLQFELRTGYADRVLVALGYAPNVKAESATVSSLLSWAPREQGLRWELAEGEIELDFRNGQLSAVKPGASRALALLNFYTLPRRLALNFDDVVGEGLAFDRISGAFTLADGKATTQNLRVDGTSLSMDVRGSVGLLARDYDQRVTVYPDVSSGVTLGAVLLGGPAVGALVLLAQELLDKPLDQVTQFSYRISGSWDNPRIERIDAGSRPAATAR